MVLYHSTCFGVASTQHKHSPYWIIIFGPRIFFSPMKWNRRQFLYLFLTSLHFRILVVWHLVFVSEKHRRRKKKLWMSYDMDNFEFNSVFCIIIFVRLTFWMKNAIWIRKSVFHWFICVWINLLETLGKMKLLRMVQNFNKEETN